MKNKTGLDILFYFITILFPCLTLIFFSCLLNKKYSLIVFLKPFFPFRTIENTFLNNYLPDFLWAFVYSCCLSSAKHLDIKKVLIFTFASGLIFELLQYKGVISGVFDLWDLLTYIFGGLLGFYYVKVVSIWFNRLTLGR